jgi:glucosyl-3-phosphoglycerate synthase
VLSEEGDAKGKGENLWKSLWFLTGDIIVWLDADIKNIAPKFIYGLVGPLLFNEQIGYVKAFYSRPLRLRDELRPAGGGRVTEILIRPLLNLFYPELASLMQPLSGEYAGRRAVLEKLPFSIGYGVEIGHLLDLYHEYGLEILAQVDMDMRIHRNRGNLELGRMSFGILQTFLARAAAHGRLGVPLEMGLRLMQFQAKESRYIPQVTHLEEAERPPIGSLPKYKKRGSCCPIRG